MFDNSKQNIAFFNFYFKKLEIQSAMREIEK